LLKNASVVLRIAYCLVVLGAILPFGIAASGWVTPAKGPNLLGAVPFIGPMLLLTLGFFRVYLVACYPTTLSSPPVSGLAALVRVLGQLAIYIGVVATVLSWVARPLMRALMTSRTESGAEFFAVGLHLSLVAGIGLLGLLMFEFSRLLAFERLAYERHASQRGA
jgi:hypothetical protein